MDINKGKHSSFIGAVSALSGDAITFSLSGIPPVMTTLYTFPHIEERVSTRRNHYGYHKKAKYILILPSCNPNLGGSSKLC